MAITDLLNQTVTIYTRTGHDAYGRETVSSGTNSAARFQRENKVRLLPTGQTQVIDGIVFLPTTATVNVDDKITYDGNDYKVFTKNTSIGKTGSTHHYELEVVKWS